MDKNPFRQVGEVGGIPAIQPRTEKAEGGKMDMNVAERRDDAPSTEVRPLHRGGPAGRVVAAVDDPPLFYGENGKHTVGILAGQEGTVAKDFHGADLR